MLHNHIFAAEPENWLLIYFGVQCMVSNVDKNRVEIEPPREKISDSTLYEQIHYDLFINVKLINISLNFFSLLFSPNIQMKNKDWTVNSSPINTKDKVHLNTKDHGWT